MTDEIDAGPEPDAAVDAAVNEPNETPDPVHELAASLGWKPKDEWKGDQSTWSDADVFLKQQVKAVKNKNEMVERANKAAQAVIVKQREALIKRHEAELARAREENDIDAALEAQDALTAAKTDTDVVAKQSAFLAANPWFNDDEEATSIAIAASERAAKKGLGVDEQLEAATRAVRKAMPELFDDALDTPPSKPTPKPPVVASGQRSTISAPRAKGWNDIPTAARDAADKAFIRRGDLTREEYAKSYWQENE